MRVLLVGGAGGFGRYHLQAWRKQPRVTALTVLGRDRARLAALAAETGVAVTTDWAVLAEADFVDVCTPPDTHVELAGRALEAGLPVVVEKPPGRTADQAAALLTRATSPLYCVQNLLFAPVWRRARQLLAEGLIGAPRLSLWPVLCDQTALMVGDDFRADARRGGGALLDGAFHLAYLIPRVLGRPITAVTAWAGRLAVAPPAGEDTGLAVWEHEGGVAQVTYSWAVRQAPRTPAATIIGETGTLVVPRSARQPLELLVGRETRELDLGEFRTLPRNDLANCLGHYLEACLRQTEPEATFAEALAAQRLIEATELAAADGVRRELA